MFWSLFISAGTQHGNLPPEGWPILFFGPTQEPCVSHSQHKKIWEKYCKKKLRVEIGKEEIPGSKRSMYDFLLTYLRF